MRHALSLWIAISLMAGFGWMACDTWQDPPLPGPQLDKRNAMLNEAKSARPRIEKADEAAAIEYLQSPNAWIRRDAADRLAELGSEGRSPTTPPAAAPVDTDTDTDSASEKTSEEPRAVTPAPPGEDLAPSPAVDALLKALDDDDWRVKMKVCMALDAYRDPRAIAPLIDTLVDSDRKVRLWAWKTLRHLGEPAWRLMYDRLAPEAGGQDQAFIDESGIRRNLHEMIRGDLVALGKPGVSVAVEKLASPVPEVRRLAAQILGDIGPDAKDATSALIAATAHEDLETRLAAIRSLGRFGNATPEILPALEALSTDPNKRVLDEAKKALTEVKNQIKKEKDKKKDKDKDKNKDKKKVGAKRK